MSDQFEQDARVEKMWRDYMINGEPDRERRQRFILGLLPGNPRCKYCYAPFQGPGSIVAKFIFNKRPSSLNPKLCNICERFASEYQGGAEVELSLLFADVRGSTTLAESMRPMEFSKLINRFYNSTSKVLVKTNALIDKIIGDQVAGMYVPGFAGPQHARVAVEAAQKILLATGHDRVQGPWIPLGIGVHTGIAFVGSVHSEDGISDITVLGDVPNVAARLSSQAQPGEILISEPAYKASGFGDRTLETRVLELKGKEKSTTVYVLEPFA